MLQLSLCVFLWRCGHKNSFSTVLCVRQVSSPAWSLWPAVFQLDQEVPYAFILALESILTVWLVCCITIIMPYVFTTALRATVKSTHMLMMLYIDLFCCHKQYLFDDQVAVRCAWEANRHTVRNQITFVSHNFGVWESFVSEPDIRNSWNNWLCYAVKGHVFICLFI